MAKAKLTIEMALRGQGCLGKAHPDEPVFVLRAQDLTSSLWVRAWADLAKSMGARKEKIDEAIGVASSMDEWSNRKWPD